MIGSTIDPVPGVSGVVLEVLCQLWIFTDEILLYKVQSLVLWDIELIEERFDTIINIEQALDSRWLNLRENLKAADSVIIPRWARLFTRHCPAYLQSDSIGHFQRITVSFTAQFLYESRGSARETIAFENAVIHFDWLWPRLFCQDFFESSTARIKLNAGYKFLSLPRVL